jgi:hypothetical protein
MVDIETPEAKKNGTGGTLMTAKVKVLPLGPAGPFEIDGYIIAHGEAGPDPVAHLTCRADSLPLLDFALTELRKAFAAAMKNLMEESKAAGLLRPDGTQVRHIDSTKLKGS